jgi:two-component system, chemotaxis family, CheB/CheR fusion protein
MPTPEHHPDTPVTAPTDGAFYVVAIGASAGGLDALEKLVAELPADTGAAFVVIQHLSPDHKSMMASLLARYTTMPVHMVETDTPIEPNQVYLIPPASLMHTDGRQLRLRPKSPRSLTLPIDVFFQSLATHHGRHAVGVVLSGTGTDGTRGAGAINEAGGFLLAQTPENAKFDGMPRSIIATGLVDAILPVEQMAQRIVAHVRKQALPQRDEDQPVPVRTMSADVALSGILHLLMQMGGINFEEYKPGTVMRRIERRIVVQQVGSIEAYLSLLNQDRAEVLALRRELLIPVTSFFRDTEAFEALATQVIAPLVTSKEAGQSIRVWCAGVSTGEEAYSVAMLFLEAFEQAKRWPTLKIFATDVEQVNIETASMGTYPESIMAEVSGQQLERFFVKKGNRFVVKNELRQCIVFARHNLLSDPPFTKIDLVVCRNALIYFRSTAQDKALRRMQYALGNRGYLFLGSSESLGDLQRDFQTLSVRHKIWQVVRPTTLPLELARGANPVSGVSRRNSAAGARVHSPSAVEQGYNTLLKAFAPPPAILLNAGHELVHSYGNMQRFLRIREGQASLELHRVLPDPLVPVAAALLFKSERENAPVGSDVVHLPEPTEADTPRHTTPVRLCAWPVGEHEGQRYALLSFELAANGSAPALAGEPVALDVQSEHVERIEVLEHELAATRESLQATIEELETSNEELQATNEEMMSSNEELQSSNEELQSVNEELNTVNAEYQEKIDILNRVNADLDNLIRVASDCTVFVNDQLQLTRYTPQATQIFRVRPGDLGRPLDDLAHTLDYPDLMRDLRHTLAHEVPLEVSRTGAQGRHYLIKMLPYRVPSSSVRGVVLSFTDTTSLREASFLQSVLDALAENVAVLDPQGVITMVNRAWLAFASDNGATAATCNAIGINYLKVCEAGCGSQDAPYATQAAAGLRAVLSGQQTNFSMEYPCHSPTQERWFVMNVSSLHGADGTRLGAVVSHVNISAWRQGQAG